MADGVINVFGRGRGGLLAAEQAGRITVRFGRIVMICKIGNFSLGRGSNRYVRNWRARPGLVEAC